MHRLKLKFSGGEGTSLVNVRHDQQGCQQVKSARISARFDAEASQAGVFRPQVVVTFKTRQDDGADVQGSREVDGSPLLICHL